MEDNYQEVNRLSWNKRAELHVDSEFYDNDTFKKGRNSLNEIELAILGDVSGKSILHLQCHFGQDSISLARMGAEVTGVDLSDEAIKKANELAKETNTPVHFIESDVYDLPKHLDKQFDIVFTSYGTIGWLPDINKWANIVAQFLKPGGHFVFAEFHPVVWMFDDDFQKIGYRYFKSDPIVEEMTGSYAAKDADVPLKSISWNHGLGEVMGSLISKNLEILDLQEYDYSPYNCFAHTKKIGPDKYQIEHLGNRIPMVYSILAQKKG